MRKRLVPIVLTAVFVVYAWAMAIALPVWQSPDEPLHFAVARYVHLHHRYPNGRVDRVDREIATSLSVASFSALKSRKADWRAIGNPAWPSFADLAKRAGGRPGLNVEAGHPPLYYVLVAPLDALLDRLSFPAEILLLRMLTVLMAAPAVWLTYATARLVFPRLRWLGFLTATFVALVPQIASIAGSVNNDGLTMSLGAGVLYVTARIVLEGPNRSLLAVGSLLALAGVFTKVTGVAMLGVFGAGLLWRLVHDRRGAVAVVVSAGVPALAAALWYGLRLRAKLPLGPVEAKVSRLNPHPISNLRYFRRWYFPKMVSSFYGRLGWLAVPLPESWYTGLKIGSIVGVVGSGTVAIVSLLRRRIERHRMAFCAIAVLGFVVMGVTVFRASAYAYRRYGEPRALQGRYFFPVAGVVAAGLFAGVLTIAKRFRTIVAAFLTLGMVVLSFEGLAVVIRGFYGKKDAGVDVLASRLSAFSPISAAFPLVMALFVCAIAGVGVAMFFEATSPVDARA